MDLELYESGGPRLDELITTRDAFDHVARGYADMHDGTNRPTQASLSSTEDSPERR